MVMPNSCEWIVGHLSQNRHYCISFCSSAGKPYRTTVSKTSFGKTCSSLCFILRKTIILLQCKSCKYFAVEILFYGQKLGWIFLVYSFQMQYFFSSWAWWCFKFPQICELIHISMGRVWGCVKDVRKQIFFSWFDKCTLWQSPCRSGEKIIPTRLHNRDITDTSWHL